MTWIDVYESRVIELAMERLRDDGLVWQDAIVHDAVLRGSGGEAADRETQSLDHRRRIKGVEPVRSPSRRG